MMHGGTAYEKMKVSTPDGEGVVSKVKNPDSVLVELTSREKIKSPKGEMVHPFGIYDLSELKAIDNPLPVPGSPEALAAQESKEAAENPTTPATPPTEQPEPATAGQEA